MECLFELLESMDFYHQIDVKILGQLSDVDRTVVAVQYKNMIATYYHPELTDDLCWHLYFINCIMRAKL